MVPLRRTMQNNNTERHEVPKPVGGAKHPTGICLLGPSRNSASSGTNKYNYNAHHTAEIRRKNTKTPLASPGSTPTLPDDIGDDRAHICIFGHTNPRESEVTPCEVSGL